MERSSKKRKAHSSENEDEDRQVFSTGGSTQQKILLRCEQHPATVLQGLGELYASGYLCDVTVRVGEEDFQAHRVVLAASSEFLRILLVGGWKETDEPVW